MSFTPQELYIQILKKRSMLCVGLDTDIQKIPAFLQDEADPVFEFNRRIIEATRDYAVAYKMNTAFYESLGVAGWQSLEKTLEIIPKEIFTIADAKRGDIGNTSRMYAKAFFESMDFDAITVAPYMGKDSIAPFLEFENKWVFLLSLTSNEGAKDFQWMKAHGKTLYSRIVDRAEQWGAEYPGNLGYVVGATRSEYLESVRKQAPNAFFLVPGVGAQGGDLHSVCKIGMNDLGGLLINSSRGIIYAGKGEDFAEVAGRVAKGLQEEMGVYLT